MIADLERWIRDKKESTDIRISTIERKASNRENRTVPTHGSTKRKWACSAKALLC